MFHFGKKKNLKKTQPIWVSIIILIFILQMKTSFQKLRIKGLVCT